MPTDTDRRAKLPRWAQDELDRLERELSRATDAIVQLRHTIAGNGASPWSIGNGLRDDQRLPSSVHSLRYAGQLPNAGEFEVQLRALDQHEGTGIRVQVASWHGLRVDPEASNVVVLRPARLR
jgi:hypothetical protein